MQGNSSTRESNRAPIAILGVPFDNVTTAETLDLIGAMIASGKPHYLATANVDFLVQASEDIELRRILFDAHVVLADGMPIVWAAKFLGNPLPERVTGSGMIPLLLARAEQQGWRVFFLGGTEASVAAAAEKTRAKHPNLKLVGAYSPPFKPLLEMDHADILRRVYEARPDVLLVAFGCPKQEKWINMNYRAAGVPICIGVGATIDFLAGTFKRAPRWMQASGTEWIFRMAQEPRRLFKRYMLDLWVFGRLIVKQFWHLTPGGTPTGEPARADTTADLPGSVIIKAGSRLDAPEAQKQGAAWSEAVRRGAVIFDLVETELVDSTGVGMLIRLRKEARELNHPFVLAAPSQRVMAALKLMKLESFFSIEENVTAARLKVREAGGGAVSTEAGRATGTARVLNWRGELTAANADQLAAITEQNLKDLPPGVPVVIDLSRVEFVDSVGIGLMVRLKRHLWRQDIPLRFRSPGPAVLNVLRHTKMEAYLLDLPR